MHAKSDYIFYLPVLYTEAFLNTKFLAGALQGYLKDIMTHTLSSLKRSVKPTTSEQSSTLRVGKYNNFSYDLEEGL